MKYIIKTGRYTWTDHKTNTEAVKELNISPILGKTQNTEQTCCNIQTERLGKDYTEY
jgi:hypothetical protein